MSSEITISVAKQKLILVTPENRSYTFPISTAKAGTGQQKNSNQTPLGQHVVRAKIGQNAPKFTVFRGRRPTSFLWSPSVEQQEQETDWILTRILWLSGKDYGLNRLGEVDSMQRFMYIHGTNEESLLGTPSSHGCIRMSNDDVIFLFDKTAIGTKVFINEK